MPSPTFNTVQTEIFCLHTVLQECLSKHLNCHTELSDDSDKCLRMPTVKPLTIHTIISDYVDKWKS